MSAGLGDGAISSEVKKASRLCPFREGNCPYGDKCRFNHHDTNSLDQYAARLLKPLLSNSSTCTNNIILQESLEPISSTTYQALHEIRSIVSNPLEKGAQEGDMIPSDSVFDPKYWEKSIIRQLQDSSAGEEVTKETEKSLALEPIIPKASLLFHRKRSTNIQNEPLPLMIMMSNPALSAAQPSEFYEISRDNLIDLYTSNSSNV